MNSDRLPSIAGGVSFFVLLAIFPAITALVSAYGLFFNASTITNNLSLLNDIVPDNVLSIVHEHPADRDAFLPRPGASPAW
jgi:membrane protein